MGKWSDGKMVTQGRNRRKRTRRQTTCYDITLLRFENLWRGTPNETKNVYAVRERVYNISTKYPSVLKNPMRGLSPSRESQFKQVSHTAFLYDYRVNTKQFLCVAVVYRLGEKRVVYDAMQSCVDQWNSILINGFDERR